MRRRRCALWLASGLAVGPTAAASAARAEAADPVRRGRPLVFPRDHGAHLSARTEWWYATGWLGRPEAPTHGFQITFFRSRTGLAEQIDSRFAARQLLFAHAAVTDLGRREHRHDQRIVRWNGTSAGGEAAAASGDLAVRIGGWSLHREATDGGGSLYVAQARLGSAAPLALRLRTSSAPLLQGDDGYSRKGPGSSQASHYYSEPQLRVSGSLGAAAAEGAAWLDHEWSEQIMPPEAVGWDWVGFNLFDGSALTAFRLRRADGSALWAGGSFRSRDGELRVFGPAEPHFVAGRRWTSAATGAAYPVQWQLDSPAGQHQVRALLDAQELDSRSSTGTVYWEGLSELLDAGGRRIGLGYLEMTGYAGRLRL